MYEQIYRIIATKIVFLILLRFRRLRRVRIFIDSTMEFEYSENWLKNCLKAILSYLWNGKITIWSGFTCQILTLQTILK